MNELQSVTDIDEVIKYAEREAEGCHKTASAYHTDEGVYLHEETRFQYKAILWENIHEWLEELKERRKKQRPHGEWIPCSERLPKPDKYVLVCSDEGNIEVAEGFISTEIEEFVWLTSGWRFGTVIAWMPLPEPYKGGDEE